MYTPRRSAAAQLPFFRGAHPQLGGARRAAAERARPSSASSSRSPPPRCASAARPALSVRRARAVALPSPRSPAGRASSAPLCRSSGVIAFYVVARLARRLPRARSRPSGSLRRARGSRGPRRRRPPRSRSASGSRARCTTCSPTRSPGSRCSSRARGCWRPGPRAARPGARRDDRARPPSRQRRASRRRGARSGCCATTSCPGPERLERSSREFERDSAVPAGSRSRGAEHELGSDARLTLYRVGPGGAHERAQARRAPSGSSCGWPTSRRARGSCVEDFAAQRRGPPPPANGGYGLTGMRERAELLGGTLAAGPTGGGLPGRAVGARVTPIRVVLADDQRVVREGLAMLLGLLAGRRGASARPPTATRRSRSSGACAPTSS